jgi:hypothetical protein
LAATCLDVPDDEEVVGIQDNVRLHKSDVVKDAARDASVTFLANFPPRSPDRNPIENMFGMAEHELRERAVKDKITKPDAEEKCVKRFEEILAGLATSGKIRKLARSMPDRIKACIAAEGGATDY